MAKKIVLELTKTQLQALVNVVDDYSAQIGCGDTDEYRVKQVKHIDKMLKTNGYTRQYE